MIKFIGKQSEKPLTSGRGSLEGETNKELKNKVSLTILDKECLQRESPSL